MKNLTAIILIVLSVGLFFFYMRPAYATVTSLRAQETSYNDAISQTKEVATQSNTLIQQYNSISDSDKTKLAEMIPAKFDLIAVTADISSIASRYGFVIKQIAVSNPTVDDVSGARTNVIDTSTGTPYQVNTISFTTSGSYANFLAFLKDIESNVELMDVTSITVSQGGQSVSGTSGTGALTFTITLDTYSIQ